jgi:hypothetical protein
MHVARMKLSNRDQEAMRRMRAQMIGSPNWNANNISPVKVDERTRIPQPLSIPEAGPSTVSPFYLVGMRSELIITATYTQNV